VDVLGAVPVKPFAAAKQRLASILPAELRWRLSQELSARTVAAVRETGATPLVLAADLEVAGWAEAMGVEVLLDRQGSLDQAATGAAFAAQQRAMPWLICHADLPLVNSDDLAPLFSAVANHRWVIAPSSDGGTSLIGGHGGFTFSYGPGSFHRHLVSIAEFDPIVTVRLGLALDLDEPADLAACRSHLRGRWLEDLVNTLSAS
jgi:2-phospho-L-lactate/phosphoenolpyruvate guanylyltransferase